nr:PREDICTED: uncharacterized protein LOC102354679 [Latimeria chalumnae]|eukprot:XP_014339478.1 PREDICTED: uncharacterized protein LOC102354679 [Latimeria chalumnae]
MVVRGVPVSGVLLFLAVVSFSPLLSDSVSHGGTFILNFTNPKEDFLFYFRGKKGLIPREYDYRSDSWRFPETDSRITVTKSEDYIQISLLRTTVADEGEYVVEKTTGKALLRRILTVTGKLVCFISLIATGCTIQGPPAFNRRIRHLLVVVVTFVVLFVFLFMCMKRRGAASEVASGHRSQHGATTEGAVLEAISRNDLANEGPSQYEEAEVDTLLEVETRSDMENGHLP